MGANSVAAQTPIILAFSEPMQPGSVMVSLSPAVPLGAPVWSTADDLVTFTPPTPFSDSASYMVTVVGTSATGTALPTFTFSFTTAAATPTPTPPTIINTNPDNGATGVPTTAKVRVVFSRAMNGASVTVSTTPPLDLGEPEWGDAGRVVSFPGALDPFNGGTVYTVAVEGDSVQGLALSGPKSFAFTTQMVTDTTAPTVGLVQPEKSATGVPRNAAISVSFSEAMFKPGTEAAFSTMPATTCAFTWDAPGKRLTCTPSAPLAASTTYTVRVGSGAQDLASNALAAASVWTFTTGATSDSTAPTFVSSTPANNAGGVVPETFITVVFSEPMDMTSTEAAFDVTNPAMNRGRKYWNAAGTTLYYDPVASFAPGTAVSWTVAATAKDLAGNPLGQAHNAAFSVARRLTVTLHSVGGQLDGQIIQGLFPSVYSWSWMSVGDIDDARPTVRGFITFDLSQLPATATRVVAANLTLTAESTTGTPNALLGPLLAQSVDYGGTLDLSDYDLPVLTSTTCGLLGCTTSDEVQVLDQLGTTTIYTAPATAKVADDWEKRLSRNRRSQYRIRFTIDTDGTNAQNYLLFYTGSFSVPGLRPGLDVTYEYP